MIVIDMISFNNLLAPFYRVLGKEALFPAWWSWQAVLNFGHIHMKKLKQINKKFQPDSNILNITEAGRGNCLPYA